MCSFCSYKCCFIFFNFLFLVSGVALIIIGVKEHSTYLLLGTFAMQSLSKITIVLIAVGVAITLVSLLGHLGAFFNVKTMVSCFVCILIIVIILEVLTGAVFYLVGKRTVLLKLKDSINGKTLNVMHDFTPEKRCALEEIQEKFKCCGTFGPGDWSTTVGWENHEAVPDSCCVVKTEHCGQNMTNIHSKGCVKNIAVFMMKNLLWVAIVCVVLGISEVFGVLVGVCFRMNMKQKSYENMS
ncbi:CD63 antigen-like [Pungitius pungitius]|uniref:CD63 antigen-like n=1 Tax=Pungitius pungitius TaxID=134920 RepID=UPI001887EC18|nr:CD63 antigen-like [Pungitius pungitius]